MQQSRFDQAAKQAAAQMTPQKADGEQIRLSSPIPEVARIMLRLYSGQIVSARPHCTTAGPEIRVPNSVLLDVQSNPSMAGKKRPFSSIEDQISSVAEFGFFWDVPWGAVPTERHGNITRIPMRSRGTLLGGSSKSSKLAALVAARKKQEEEKRTAATSNAQTERAVSLLGRLGAKKENFSVGGAKISTSFPQSAPRQELPLRTRTNQPGTPQKERPPSPAREEAQLLPLLSSQVPRGPPSMFAQAIFGHEEGNRSYRPTQSTKTQNRDRMFSLPFTLDEDYKKRDPFAGPSPDDVILQAQSKGSLPGLKRINAAD